MTAQGLNDPKTRKLMYYRIRRSMTLKDLSKKTGLSTATLHRLERGNIKPSLRSKLKLMDGLNLGAPEVDELFKEGMEAGGSTSKALHSAAPAI